MMSSQGPQRHLPTKVQAEVDLRTCARASVPKVPSCECTAATRRFRIASHQRVPAINQLKPHALLRRRPSSKQQHILLDGLIYDVTRPASVAVCDSVAITTIVSFQITVRSPAATLAWISIAFPAPKRQTR